MWCQVLSIISWTKSLKHGNHSIMAHSFWLKIASRHGLNCLEELVNLLSDITQRGTEVPGMVPSETCSDIGDADSSSIFGLPNFILRFFSYSDERVEVVPDTTSSPDKVQRKRKSFLVAVIEVRKSFQKFFQTDFLFYFLSLRLGLCPSLNLALEGGRVHLHYLGS